ncbi:MAG: DNA polymerase III subunit beta [Pseudomonadota bacterium]
MLIETTAGDLRLALNLVKPVIHPRNTLPILSAVLLKDGAVWATDLDLEIKLKFAAKTFKGAAAIPFRQLFGLLSGLPHDMDIRIQSVGQATEGVYVFFRGGRYKLTSLPVEDFPEWVSLSDLKPMNTTKGFRTAVQAVEVAVSTEETRYYLNGVCFSKNQAGEGVLVATDGHRMVAHHYDHGQDGNLILPRLALPALALLPEPSAISANGSRMTFQYPGGEFRSKLIEGTFPDWHRVVPSPDEDTPSLSFAPMEMMSVLNRVGKISGRLFHSRCVDLSAPANGEMVVVAARGMDQEECSERLDSGSARNWAGPKDHRAFNVSYLKELCALHRHSERVAIVATSSKDPAIITSEDKRLLCILMPMRSGNEDLMSASIRAFTQPDNDSSEAVRAA